MPTPEMNIKYFIAKWNCYETKAQKISFAREMERDLKALIKIESQKDNQQTHEKRPNT